jgi:putative transcriptional regulator
MDKYFIGMINSGVHYEGPGSMIKIRIDELLKTQERTFYWLAKETGVSHTTLWRLKKEKAQGITFNTLERICEALECQPGDVLTVGRARAGKKK